MQIALKKCPLKFNENYCECPDELIDASTVDYRVKNIIRKIVTTNYMKLYSALLVSWGPVSLHFILSFYIDYNMQINILLILWLQQKKNFFDLKNKSCSL